jgi:predicted Zn-dependent protease with MMP-like domain
MGRHSKPDLDDPFEEAIDEAARKCWGADLPDPLEEAIDEALNSLPLDLRAAASNVGIVVEDEPPDGQLLGLYSGLPRAPREIAFAPGGMLPARVSIFRGPLTRLAAGDTDRLRREVRQVVLRELAHYFEVE